MKITEPFKPFEAGGKVYHGYILAAADELDEQIESYLNKSVFHLINLLSGTI